MKAPKLLPEKYWWKTEDEKMHESIFPIVGHLRANQSYRTERNLMHMRLYGNMDIAGMHYKHFFTGDQGKLTQKIKLNVCKSAVDTVVSKLCKNRPRPMFLTDGGDHSMKMRAKKLNKYVGGLYHQISMWERGAELARDQGVFDIGALKFWADNGKIHCERVFPEEVLVDDQEGVYKNPRTMFQVKPVARECLLADYSEFVDDIMGERKSDGIETARNMTDLIDVVEAWHLPTDGKDGKHVIAIRGKTLLSEGYDLEMFPILVDRWSDRLVGWYGQGIVEQLLGLQIEINRTLKSIQECIKFAVPKVLVENGSKVVPVSNLIMGTWKYTGKKPDIEVLNSVPPVLFEYLAYLYQKAFEQIGVSQLSAQSQKPAGLDSGRALREYTDIESDRFVVDAQRYENTIAIEAARLCIALTRQEAEKTGKMKVPYKDKRGMKMVDWSEAEMKDDEYSMILWPRNLLPDSPAGKLATVQEMMADGMLGQEDAKRLLDFPDIESVTSLTNAPYEIMDMIIEELLEGRWIAPEPYFKLDFCIQRMQEAYLKSRMDKVPDPILEKMRRWIDQATLMFQAGAPGIATAPQEPQPGPEAPVMPPGVVVQ